jgi:SAM-dependent methyltransferase
MNEPLIVDRPSMVGGLRLNLGGRDKPIPGFSTVDVYEGPEVDYKMDCAKLDFDDGEVEEIYASHILEHFPHTQTLNVLKEWRRVLKKGSIARIAVPDFDAVVKIYQKEGFGEFLRNFLWGDQAYDKAFHFNGFTFSTLAILTMKAGFSDVKRVRNFPYLSNDCSNMCDSMYHILMSLNIEAIA